MLKLNKKRTMTKKHIIKLFGSVQNAANWFGIDRCAVYSWPDNDLIPELRELQIRETRLIEKVRSLKRQLKIKPINDNDTWKRNSTYS